VTAVSANLMFPIDCHSDAPYVGKICCGKEGCRFCVRSCLLESVIVTELQAPEAYSSLDLTKAKYPASADCGG
jgi:hypothetical protein